MTCSPEVATPSKAPIIDAVPEPRLCAIRVEILTSARYIERARKDQASPYALPLEAGDEDGDKSAEPTS